MNLTNFIGVFVPSQEVSGHVCVFEVSIVPAIFQLVLMVQKKEMDRKDLQDKKCNVLYKY
jgi:hypothetical protein